MVLPGVTNDAVIPGGDSYGSVTVSTLGSIAASGALSDGTSFTQHATLSELGNWPFYVSLYSGTGEIIGCLAFSNAPMSDLAGPVTWIKPSQPTSKFYPGGFTLQTEAVGSLFQFTTGVPVLNFAAGQLLLADGNLPQNLTNQFTLEKNSKVTSTNKTILTISTSTGLFTGSVLNPANKKAIAISGAVLQ